MYRLPRLTHKRQNNRWSAASATICRRVFFYSPSSVN